MPYNIYHNPLNVLWRSDKSHLIEMVIKGKYLFILNESITTLLVQSVKDHILSLLNSSKTCQLSSSISLFRDMDYLKYAALPHSLNSIMEK